MGVSLLLRRRADLYAEEPCLTPDLALTMFAAMPWVEDIQHYDSLAPNQEPEDRPEFGLIDDAGRLLRITPYTPELAAVSYHYPILTDEHDNDSAYLFTNLFPAAKIPNLLRLYFAPDHQPIFRLLELHPSSTA